MVVRFTSSARAQVLSGLQYIKERNPQAARNLKEQAHEALELLTTFPDSGRLIPEFPDLPYRELILPPYRFFYRHDGQTIWVVAVWHSKQLPQEPTDG